MLYNRDYRMILKSGQVVDKDLFCAQYSAGIVVGCAVAVMIYAV